MSLPSPSTNPFADPGGSILIADDDPLVRRAIATSLRGFTLFEASDGLEALEIIEREVIDLVLLDEQMPGQSGMLVCRELRKREDTAFTPILLFTGFGGEEKKVEALQAGANDFMSKPLSPVELKVRVNNLLTSNFYQKSLNQKNQELEITLKKLEESSAQLIRSERLLAMSRFSTGLLHHVNNPLNHTKSALSLIARFLPEDTTGAEGEDFQEALTDAVEGLDRVIAIIQHLRGFSQSENASVRIFDLSRAIRSSVRGMPHQGVTVEFVDRLPESFDYSGDLRLICQTVNAIYQNALDAFSRAEDSDEPHRFEASLEHCASFIEIIFTDNGGGIDAEILPKVTDPFFTTRLSGSGAGLGLSFVEAVASFCGGTLQVSSSDGSTTVRVRFMRI